MHTAFSYRLIKADGSPDLFSKTFSPRVIGLSTLLAAPIALDEIAGTLDPDLPRTQVDIPWNDIMVPGNVIMLVWEGMTASGTPYVPDLPLHPISDDEDGKTLEISVEGEHLKAIENGTLDLCYWLLSDAITRAAVGHKSLYAEQLRLGQPQVELPEPVVEGENGGVLDPADVPTTGTRLIVRQYDGQIEEDVVHILWWGSVTGRYRNQLKLNSITDKIDVPFTIRKALVDDNRNGTVRAMYWVKRANGRTSASAVLLMSIGAALDLSAPSVKQATGNAPSQQLNPVAAKDELTVVIPDYGIRAGDEVSVTWAGTAGAGSHTTPLQALPGSREITLPVSLIAYNLDRSVTITYTVTPSGGNESPPSATLNLAVQTIAQDDLLVAKPRITQAQNNGEGAELDLSTLTGNGTVRIDSWPLIAAGQYVWLRLKGTNTDNLEHNVTLWEPPSKVSSQWVSDGFATNVAELAYLRELKHGSTLTVEFKASLNQSLEEDQATPFPLRTYTVQAVELITPTLDSVKDADEVEIPEGTTTVSLTLKLSGTASKGQDVEIYDGSGASAELKGQATADPNTGIWTKEITVGIGGRRLYAKALYPVSSVFSNVRLLTVVDLLGPTLTDIRDSKGSVVGGTTVETSVTVTGTGSKGQQIQLLDGTTNIGSPVSIPAGGTAWSTTLTGLTVKAYSLKAKALYGTGVPDSAAKDFNRLNAATPAITAVNESTTPAIPNGGITAATSVVLTGSATPGLSIDLFDNTTTLKGTFVATGGTWTTTTPIAVDPGPHSFTAKAKYGSEPVSGAWTFTVITLTDQNKPYIQQAENNGTGAALDLGTFAGDATVKVSPWPGIKAGQRVWLRCLGKKANGADHIITLYTASAVVPAEETNGLSKNIPRAQLEELGNNTPLTVELKIKFNGSTSDDAATVFPLRTYTVKVVALITPTLDSVKGDGVEIPNGGTTTSLTLQLSGTATKGQDVEIYDGSGSGAVLKGEATADANTGIWTKDISVVVGDRRLYAKASYLVSPVYSNVHTFKVIERLVIDTSTVQLNGFFVYTGMQRNSTPMPAGTTVTRRPTSGTGPFSYRSSNTAVAQVDGNGVVVGYKNGQANIEVSDTYGQTVSYPVVRSNAWKIVTIPSIQAFNAPAWANSVGANNSFNGTRPDNGTMAALRQYYVMVPGWNYDHWTGQFENGNPNWPLFANPYTGYISTSAREAWLGAYCRVPDNA